MTKHWTQWTMTALCAFALSAGVAQAAGPSAKDRQITQQKRIAQGVKSGELTRAETRGLQRNAARVRRSIATDRHDQGVFTPRERAKAQRQLSRQSKAIAKQKHDAQDR